MATYTSFLNLEKPTTSERLDVLKINSNWDKIDEGVSSLNSKIANCCYLGTVQNKSVSLNQTSGIILVADFDDLTAPAVTGRTFIGYIGFIESYRATVIGFGGKRCYYTISAPTTADVTIKIYPMYK